MKDEIATRYREFEIPGTAQVVEGNGGLPKVRITTPDVIGEIYLHGAHITSWKPYGEEEVLFLSSQSRWEDGHAIRGGVPICFPWFGGKADDPKAPAHGFVRTKSWHLESISQVGNVVTVSMFTESDETTRRWWPSDFRLVNRVTFGLDLSLEPTLTNTGTSWLSFEEALHAYHQVGHVEKVRLRGLDTVRYLDKTDSNRAKAQSGDVVITSETDRVYLDTPARCAIEDGRWCRRVLIEKHGAASTVVWNPWAEKGTAMADLSDPIWRGMVCVETGNVADNEVQLAAVANTRCRWRSP